jgi:hypothetical protein
MQKNIASLFDAVIFGITVSDGVVLDLKLSYLSYQTTVLEVTSPWWFRGEVIRIPHIAAFASPFTLGYHYRAVITPKLTDSIMKSTRFSCVTQKNVYDESRLYQNIGIRL